MSEAFQRRLAAIVATDVVGYSRLMGLDEDATLSALQGHRRALIEPLIARHGGRIANTAGDSILMEFPSAVEALRFAVAMQEGVAARNEGADPDRAVRFRAGINVGEVIPDGEDLLGDGVNVAARLEGLAPAGGVCLSRAARDQVRDRLEIALEDLGEVEVRNIARPVHVFRVAGLGEVTDEALPRAVARLPSIAVLPFDNRSGDAEQAYFAEGIAEDIITELARFPDLTVIARNSSFSFKGPAVRVQEIAAALGARYVLQGSVRKGGNRVRIAAQLVDGESGDTIWAERYDRDLADIFDVQDEITQRVVANVPGRISVAELGRVRRKKPEELSAYEYVLRGKQLHHRATPEDNAEAMRLLDTAIALDPNYASAYGWKACTIGQALGMGVSENPDNMLELSWETVNKGLALDDNDIECHRILAEFAMSRGEWDKAEFHHGRAFQLNPNDPRIMAQRGELMTRLGRAEEGLGWLERTNQVDPQAAAGRAHLLARASFAAGRYGEAVTAWRQVGQKRADHLAEMAAALAMAGDEAGAEVARGQVLAMEPGFTASGFAGRQMLRRPEDIEHLREALTRAGLPA